MNESVKQAKIKALSAATQAEQLKDDDPMVAAGLYRDAANKASFIVDRLEKMDGDYDEVSSWQLLAERARLICFDLETRQETNKEIDLEKYSGI